MCKVLAKHENVIINGDLWKYPATTFDRFVKSAWTQLFPLLKSKKTIYVIGNHDESRWLSEETALFASEVCYDYEVKTQECVYKITHGHMLSTALRAIDMYHANVGIYFERVFKSFVISSKVQEQLVKKTGYPNNPGSVFTQHQMKKYAQKNLKPNEVLVVGHSHIPELDLANKFINTGFFDYGRGYFLELPHSGLPKLESLSY